MPAAAVWPADAVTRRKISTLVPYARNSRTHSDEQVAQIAASIREWGWTVPVLIDPDGGIIAGHGRVLAAQRLGIAEIPCMVADGWTEAQKRAYVIADNKLALNAGWDADMLKVELGELSGLDFDLSLVGFDDTELSTILADKTEGLTDPDQVPELQDAAITERGDVWLLGNHRLRCGDSTAPSDVDALLNGVKPHLMVTDPPYGVSYDASWRAKVTGAKVADGRVLNDDRADWRQAWALFPGSVAYVWHGALHSVVVAESLMAAKFNVRSQIVWVKTRAPISRGNYHWQHEPAFYAERSEEAEGDEGFLVDHDIAAYVVRAGKTAQWSGGRRQSTVWMIEHLKSNTGHSTQKPVECMKRPIENNSSLGQAVYEPFSGSGTTIIAAEMTARCCFAIELNPAYVDVAVKRWQAFTGKRATLENDGRTFAEIVEERSRKEVA